MCQKYDAYKKTTVMKAAWSLKAVGQTATVREARVIYINRSHHRFFSHMLLLEYGFAGEQE